MSSYVAQLRQKMQARAQAKDVAQAQKEAAAEQQAQAAQAQGPQVSIGQGRQEAPQAGRPLIPGNIDLNNRPIVYNKDGSYSTVRSLTVAANGKQYVIPSISDDGRLMSNEEAFRTFQRTGKHLGAFADIPSANHYAQNLHEDQAGQYEQMSQRGDPTVGPPNPRLQMSIGPIKQQAQQAAFDARVKGEDRPVEPAMPPWEYAQMAAGLPAAVRGLTSLFAKKAAPTLAKALAQDGPSLLDEFKALPQAEQYRQAFTPLPSDHMNTHLGDRITKLFNELPPEHKPEFWARTWQEGFGRMRPETREMFLELPYKDFSHPPVSAGAAGPVEATQAIPRAVYPAANDIPAAVTAALKKAQ